MKWITALIIGAVLGIVLPTDVERRDVHRGRITGTGLGTIQPLDNSPGLLLSVPDVPRRRNRVRLFFNWHSR